ncbi:hypothetical protein Poli38472_006804 [Pythium oligandrum]|uniref:Uncharacterized protein n=1 Tax=Pythium oligandrum TaxID=41045 RepID=A0A8K1C5F3_PYTOL|nr:hypothetical protein Poli38472_006804 [Pythium oligandrum]|eukprot:TMW56794.1 hypothetical protein Poli38472_006804 [Pythium oligandrum]
MTRPSPNLRWLRWINALVYVVQRLVNTRFSSSIRPASQRHETLITPDRYAFSIWGVIYLLLPVAIIVDCFCPVLSIFSFIDDPLRLLFTLACLANMGWTVSFSNDYVNVATVILVIQWLALGILFSQIISTRRDYGFSFPRFVCSELGLTMYFAWTSAATLISFAVTFQYFADGYLSLMSYVVFLSLLTVATVSILVYARDIAYAAVAIWALVGIAVKDVQGLDTATEQISLSIRAAATQSAAIIAAFVVITISRKIVRRFMPKKATVEERSLPLLSEKTLSIEYGSVSV